MGKQAEKVNALNAKLNKKDRQLSTLVILMFVIAWVSMQLSLPALPTLINVFHTSAPHLKLSVSLFFGCFAISQLFWGGLSEKYGRKPIIMAGLCLSLLGTLIIICSQGIYSYIVGRCLEGIGMGAMAPIGRAIISDVFDSKHIARILAFASASVAVIPALAPIAGGFILVYMGWRFIFIFFFLILLGYTVWSVRKLPETHQSKNKKLSASSQVKSYYKLFKHRNFWAYTGCYALAQGTMLGYYGAMPFWYVTQWHIAENHYAFLALFSVSGYLISLFVAHRLIITITLERLLKIGLWLLISASVLAFIFSIIGFSGIIPLVSTMTVFAIGGGLIFITSNTIVISQYKPIAAVAAALTTTSVCLMAALFSWIESHLSVHSLWELAPLLLLVSLTALTINQYWHD